MTTFDIIIVGGGMVGATLACTLQKNDLKVALIDATPWLVPEDERLIALNDGSSCLYQNMDLWQAIEPYAAPIHQVHVSQQGRFGITRLHAKELQLSALGYVVPAKYINATLTQSLNEVNTIKIFRPATLQALRQDAEGVDLSITTEQGPMELRAKRVIGADGSASTVRQLLNIPVEKIDYQQSALVTVTELTRDHQQIAYERFQHSGAIAMLPLQGRRVATIWTDDNAVIQELMALNDAAFLARLQKQFGYRLGRLQGVVKRASYPLQMLRAKEQTKQHVTLIGNALHTMHPIAAQGLNVALYDIALFHNPTLAKGKFSGGLGDRLHGLFSTDLLGFNQARQMAMVALDIFPPIKKRFTLHAMGKKGVVPQLLIRKHR